MFTNYYDAREWLESFIPLVYGKEELGLERIKFLLKLLGNPQNKFKSILIAGTSGKGSTAFYTAKLLQVSRSKVKVGLHVSPHLVDIRERMQINGKLIPMDEFIRLMSRIRPIVEGMKISKVGLPSYFEILVAASFKYFADEKVDWAVVEVGLGGRLDATNVLTPKVLVITNIGLDHMEILGKTVEKIAFEKAGVIKPGKLVVTGAKGRALEVIKKVANKNKAPLLVLDRASNQLLALSTVKVLGIDVSGAELEKAFELGFPGRFEVRQLADDDCVILDGAHNPDKMRALLDFVNKSQTLNPKLQIILVLAFKKGKRWKRMVDLLVKNLAVEKIIATEFNAVTDTGKFAAVPAEEIARYVKSKWKVKVESQNNSQEAVFKVLRFAQGKLVLVTGSLYLVGEVRTMWKVSEI